MIQNIDFLPNTYRQRQQQRQKRIWRRGVLVMFVGLVGLGAFGQWQQHRRMIHMRDELQQQGRHMLEQLERPATLQSRLQQLETEANLLTGLRLRVPPTRVLASLGECLPEFVSLTELRMSHERKAETRSPSTGGSAPALAAQSGLVEATPRELDLKRLHEQQDQQALVVTLSGIAPDDVSISRFLAALQGARVFDDVRLQFTSEHRFRDHQLRSFGMRLRVRNAFESVRVGTRGVADVAFE